MKDILLSESEALENAERIELFSSRHWRNPVDLSPGVYVIWSRRGKKSAVYVGETSNLRERLRDVGNWNNHTFTRKISKKIDSEEHKVVRAYIRRNFLISFLPVMYGRKELEEYLVSHWATDTNCGYNNPTPRRWRCDA